MFQHRVVQVEMCHKTDHLFTERITLDSEMVELLNKIFRLMAWGQLKYHNIGIYRHN
jgi:hypothetical protein